MIKLWSWTGHYFIETSMVFFFNSKCIFFEMAASMLATDDGDKICWRQLWDVGDGFGRFCRYHPLSFSTSVGQQHPKDVTNIEILSWTPENCYQHKVTNIHLSPISMKSFEIPILNSLKLRLSIIKWSILRWNFICVRQSHFYTSKQTRSGFGRHSSELILEIKFLFRAF